MNERFLEQFGRQCDSESDDAADAIPFFPIGVSDDATATWNRRTEEQNYHCFHEFDSVDAEVVTWNVAQRKPDDETEQLVRDIFTKGASLLVIVLEEIDFSPTAVIIGTSELCQRWGEVFDRADAAKVYEKVFEDSLGGVYMRILRLKDAKEVVNVNETKYIRLGSNGLTANKSAILCCLSVDSVKFVFTGCHLIPHNENNHERNLELAMLIGEIEKFKADYSIITGDLNYRIDMEASKVVDLISEKDFPKLLEAEQLNRSKVDNPSFSSYNEGEITFPPTYKFLPSSSDYDVTRIPSWTDRILVHSSDPYRAVGFTDEALSFETDIIRHSNIKSKFQTESNFSIKELPNNFPSKPKCVSYISYQDNYFSDHRPVSAIYSFSIPIIINDKFKKFMEIRSQKYDEIFQLSFPKCEINPKSFEIDESKDVSLSNISCRIINWKVGYLPENVELSPSNGIIFPGEEIKITIKCLTKFEDKQFVTLDIEGIPLFFEFWQKK